MKRFIPLLIVFGAGLVASLAVASPPPGHGRPTSSTSTKAASHAKVKCHPVNLRGTVASGTIALNVTKAAGPRAKQVPSPANLTVSGSVTVQAWLCSAAGSSSSAAAPTLFLRQLHVGGSPHQLGSTTTTSP
jgi:hypothetical protein